MILRDALCAPQDEWEYDSPVRAEHVEAYGKIK